uniref:T9SS type A sorting domain-containing protein n=1 Tax=candidate division WOR-3 bacterium TaxID=2052148 RepID=A0A7C4X9S0_UNCW3
MRPPTLAIDSSGNPYVLVAVWRTASPPILDYLLLFSKSNGIWSADTFELNAEDPLYSIALTIDKNNRPWCIYTAYYNDGVDTVWYLIVVHKDSTGWVKDTVESRRPQDGPSFYWTSITTDNLLGVHIAYDYSINGWHYAYYAFLNDSIWQKEKVDTTFIGDYCCSIDVDSQNRPHISYFRDTASIGENLWYAKKVDSVWYCEEVDHTMFASWWPTSIRVNPVNDLPAIAYRDPLTYQMKYAWYDGTIWHIDIVALEGFIMSPQVLDFDSSGRPWMIYCDEGYGRTFVAYKDTNGFWHTELLPLLPPLTYSYPGALRIGQDGTIHMTRIGNSDDFCVREIHYIYGTPEGIEEGAGIKMAGERSKLIITPNIVRGNARIQFTIFEKQCISLKLYDLTGREVMVISDGIIDAGTHSYDLNVTSLISGIYFLILEGEKEVKTRKLLVIR